MNYYLKAALLALSSSLYASQNFPVKSICSGWKISELRTPQQHLIQATHACKGHYLQMTKTFTLDLTYNAYWGENLGQYILSDVTRTVVNIKKTTQLRELFDSLKGTCKVLTAEMISSFSCAGWKLEKDGHDLSEYLKATHNCSQGHPTQTFTLNLIYNNYVLNGEKHSSDSLCKKTTQEDIKRLEKMLNLLIGTCCVLEKETILKKP